MQARNWWMGIGLLVATAAHSLPAQSWIWTREAPATSPPARTGAAMAFDSARQRTVLFGGFDGSNTLGDTWEWDGQTWTQRLVGAPVPRQGHAMAYDSARQRVVLFGGRSGTSYYADTWEWDGSAWLPRLSAQWPTARSGHAMAYTPFPLHARVVLFGGQDASGYLGDTWEWDGSNWAAFAPSQHPSPRAHAAMSYETRSQRLMLIGGIDANGVNGEYWDWSLGSWGPYTTTPSPSPRQGHVMALDSATGSNLLFGGSNSQNALGDTWEWRQSHWVALTPTLHPSPRSAAAMAPAPGDRLVLFGGSSGGGETWTLYLRSDLASATTYGVGCGSPPLHLTADTLPVLGQTQITTVHDVPAGAALMAIGASNAALGPFPLPLPLDAFGMPGCLLLQDLGFVAAAPCAPLPGGTARHTLAIPASPLLIDVEVYLQASAPAPGANAAGLVVSDGLHLLVGSRGNRTGLIDDFTRLDRDRSSLAQGVFGGVAGGQIGGDGRHGSFHVDDYLGQGAVDHGMVNGMREYELDTDHLVVPAANSWTGSPLTITDGQFMFTDMVLPAGVRLVFTGTHAPVFHACGRLEVQGNIDLRGSSAPLYQPSSTTTIGQPGAAGAVFGSMGGRGGNKCIGNGYNATYNGGNGQDCTVPAGHAYAGSALGTGGRGSSLFPTTGLNSSVVFGNGMSPIKYCLMAAAGGAGGGLWTAGGTCQVLYNNVNDPGLGVPPRLDFLGPPSTGGIAMQLLPLPAGVRSSQHFLVGGAGGGGGGSHALFQNNFLLPTSAWAPGSGGGGGGGALALIAGDSLLLWPQTQLLLRGGAGSRNDSTILVGTVQCAPGGGGSGGSLLLQSGNVYLAQAQIDVRGGAGGYLNRQTSVAPPDGGRVEIAGGDGAPGYYRLEVPAGSYPTPAMLPNAQPAATASNVAALLEQDDTTAAVSLWRSTGSTAPPIWDGYVLEVDSDGNSTVAQVYTDDPSSTLPTGSTAQLFGPANSPALPAEIRFQGARLDPNTGQPLPGSIGPWREYLNSGAGPSLNLDGADAYRFTLLFHRSVQPGAVLEHLTVLLR